ncbi:ASCH domain-containing protein [Anaeromyxobacter terrae]|uniref:ASCH domain-containing protein n=1 Tax=Anaeromyxobacter terrae TaxID=2925406 RepID=UPI0038CBFE6F
MSPHARSKRRGAIQERAAISRGLIILPGPLDKILAGTKTLEIRSRATAVRGPVALIESGSGTIVGTCTITGCVGPLTRADCQRNARRAGFSRGTAPAPGSYAWIVSSARRLRAPVAYRHPRGAIIWVRLTPAVTRLLPRRRAVHIERVRS